MMTIVRCAEIASPRMLEGSVYPLLRLAINRAVLRISSDS